MNRWPRPLDRRGSITLESFCAWVPVGLSFIALCQATDLYAHQLILQRAASAAVRAAVVVLPDDGVAYGDPDNRLLHRFAGERKRAVEAAAQAILRASNSFDPQATSVEVSERVGALEPMQVRLASDYRCWPRPSLVCGVAGKLRLTARASLTYQFAPYRYARRG